MTSLGPYKLSCPWLIFPFSSVSSGKYSSVKYFGKRIFAHDLLTITTTSTRKLMFFPKKKKQQKNRMHPLTLSSFSQAFLVRTVFLSCADVSRAQTWDLRTTIQIFYRLSYPVDIIKISCIIKILKSCRG